MRWVGYLELEGLHAAVHQGRMGVAGVALVVLRDGVAVDGSPRARRSGVRPGMPRHHVLRQVPDALLVRFEDADYGPAIRAVWSACSCHSPQVEPLGPGRAFVGLETPGPEPPRAEMARILRSAVRAVARVAEVAPSELDGAAGLATGKLVARAVLLGPGRGEPSGEGGAVMAVPAGQEPRVLAPLPVEALWKAPPEVIARLRTLGLRRVGEVAEMGESALWPHLGPLAWQLVQWARGRDPEPVRALWPPRGYTWRRAFPEAIGAADLPPVLARAAEALSACLREAGEAGQTVCLHLEPAEGLPVGAEERLPRPQQDAGYLERALTTLLRRLLPPPDGAAPARFFALRAEVTDLSPAGRQQLGLWDRDRQAISLRLSRALAAAGARFPPRALQLGANSIPAARREHMLQFYDPLRQRSAGRRREAPLSAVGHGRSLPEREER